MSWYVYALIDPRDNAIRYVGKSSNPAKRLQSHQSRSAATAVRSWLESLGETPKLDVLAECTSETDALLREQEWIRRLRASGAKLLNAVVRCDDQRVRKATFVGIGDRVKLLCERRGLSQKALASLVGMDQGGLSRVCSGARPNITVQTAIILARALGTTVEWLATGEGTADASRAG